MYENNNPFLIWLDIWGIISRTWRLLSMKISNTRNFITNIINYRTKSKLELCNHSCFYFKHSNLKTFPLKGLIIFLVVSCGKFAHIIAPTSNALKSTSCCIQLRSLGFCNYREVSQLYTVGHAIKLITLHLYSHYTC